jgi:hypothetical protein
VPSAFIEKAITAAPETGPFTAVPLTTPISGVGEEVLSPPEEFVEVLPPPDGFVEILSPPPPPPHPEARKKVNNMKAVHFLEKYFLCPILISSGWILF